MSEAIRTAVKVPEIKKENQVSHVRNGNFYKTDSSPVGKILFLQRTIGNQAVQRLMKSGALQTKLRIGEPGDVYEQEADRVAEQVMRMPEPQAVASGSPYIHRTCLKCEDEELRRQPINEENEEKVAPLVSIAYTVKSPPAGADLDEEQIRRKEFDEYPEQVCPKIQSRVDNLRGSGQAMPDSVRTFFEPRFGYDFSQVRLHIGGQASTVARAINARAFTVGKDVVFGDGEYSPGTTDGNKLLAHELTHVVQQNPQAKYSGKPGRHIRIQTKTNDKVTLQRAWVTGSPAPGINTIVCDGSGGINVQVGHIGNTQATNCLRDCVITHEQSHRADALASNATVCNGQTANRIVTVNTQPERKATEVKASNAEISCLRARPDTDECRAIISARITQMENYRDSF